MAFVSSGTHEPGELEWWPPGGARRAFLSCGCRVRPRQRRLALATGALRFPLAGAFRIDAASHERGGARRASSRRRKPWDREIRTAKHGIHLGQTKAYSSFLVRALRIAIDVESIYRGVVK